MSPRLALTTVVLALALAGAARRAAAAPNQVAADAAISREAVEAPAPAPGAPRLPPVLRAHAVRRPGTVDIDGRLGEPSWRTVPRQTGFTQRFPVDGAKADLDTSFAVLYDDDAIYVGVWAADPEPAKIRRALVRRDIETPAADQISIGIDSYFDRRTAFVFQLSAAGVQRDMLVYDDMEVDDTWDAVWTGDVAITADGWTAEFRIPLNQLRFAAGAAHEWGLQVVRIVARTQEQSSWSPWPRSGSETVSKFGVVDGIDGLQPGRRLELLPYVTGGFEARNVAAGDPLNDPLAARGNVGLDLKYGLGSAFTLSGTINPDFGQVEADPSQVNLSANELFFAERRRFFLEGGDLFRVPLDGGGSAEGQFYSRRIGAAPTVLPDGAAYLEAPTATTIYGAAKLTGKTRDGWSVGALTAVTAEETATTAGDDGGRGAAIVAPLTTYAVARVKRDLREGKTSFGVSSTAVARALDGTGLEGHLHRQAYTGGVQVSHRWAQNAWSADLSLLGSFVEGSEEAIARTQLSQRHLFQRPDVRNVTFDPTRTTMSGGGASWDIGRRGNTKHWRFGTGGRVRSPGLELNDAGFQTSSNITIPYLWGQRHDERPGDYLLNYQVSAEVFAIATEPGSRARLTDYGTAANASAQLLNYWTLAGGYTVLRGLWSTPSLRGGTGLRVDTVRYSGWLNASTDTRKRVWLSVNGFGSRDPESDSTDGGVSVGATVQARSNIDVYVGPHLSFRNDALQYVAEVRDGQDRPHFVFAQLRQMTTLATVRVNWTFSPRLSLQVYAQPFLSSGRYSEYKDVDAPHAARFEDRFARLEGASLARMDGTYTATNPRAGGTFQFGRPDFDFRELRSTVVLRWEYLPGSTVFAIWSQGRAGAGDDGRFDLGRNLAALGDAPGEHVVMVKANYWIGL